MLQLSMCNNHNSKGSVVVGDTNATFQRMLIVKGIESSFMCLTSRIKSGAHARENGLFEWFFMIIRGHNDVDAVNARFS